MYPIYRITSTALSILFMSLFCIANKYVIRVTIIINKASTNSIGSIDIGEIVAEAPSTNKMLNILEPITFPNAIEDSPFIAAIIEVTNSGSEVPIDTIVRPISWSLTPKSDAIVEALDTTIFPPNIISMIPIIEAKIYFISTLELVFSLTNVSSL